MIGRWRTSRDEHLGGPFGSERFDLVPCGLGDAFKLSWRWTTDAEILLTTTFDTSPRSKVTWMREMARPNGRTVFCHGVVPKGGGGAIGLHTMRLDIHGTIHPTIALHARSWWDKGVFAEVRRAALDHMFASDQVIRCVGVVHARNVASIFTYRRLGFRLAGNMRKHRRDPYTGDSHDTVIFEMLKEDWRAQEAAS